MKKYKLYIDGKWVDSSDGASFISYDKGNGEPVNEFAAATEADVAAACAAARKAFNAGVWSDLDPGKRADYMLKVAAIMRRRFDELAEVESRETGKPIFETSTFDIDVSIWAMEYFANMGREIKGDVVPVGDFSNWAFDFVTYEPYGVAAVIAPYNFPLHLLTRSLAPALAAGNCCVVKASSLTPTTTAIMGEIFEEAGVPAGVFNVVSGLGSKVGNALVGDINVDVVGFTGSEKVGRELMRISANAPVLKKLCLELGGKGPGIVLPDADLDIATDCQIEGFTFNTGQVCCSMSRCLVHEDVYEDYIQLLKKKIEAIKIDYQLNPDARIGCLISEEHLKEVEADVAGAIAQGAKVYSGGERYTEGLCANGPFYKPTLLVDITPEMDVWRKEIFGPVLSIIKFKTEEEALALANDTNYGLGANVFTENYKKAYWLGKKLNAGCIWVNLPNGMNMACPFGGNKNSGMGREYGSYGLHEYLKIKNNMWRMK